MPGLIESAFWLADPSNPRSGFIRIKGWCFVDKEWCAVAEEAGTAPAIIDIAVTTDTGRAVFENLRPVEDRREVARTHPGAPVDCGFCFILPITGTPIADELNFSVKYRGSVIASTRIGNLLSGVDTAAVAAAFDIPQAATGKLENLLLNEYERLSATISKKSHPLTLYVDPSFACNLKCPHCISENLRAKRFKRPVMKQDMFDHILEIYGPTLIGVIFTLWGEPLLNRRLAEFVRAAKRHGVFAEMSTNLSVPLSDERLDDIISAGFDEIRLSIDGATQPVYEKYRVGGSLDLVLDNLRRMVSAKKRLGLRKPVLKWQFLIWPWNRHELEAARQMATEIGVDVFYAFPGDPWTSNHEQRPRLPDDDAIRFDPALRRRICDSRDNRQRNRHHVGCDFLDHALAINSDGTVHPCCYVVEPKDAVGHILDGDDEASPSNGPVLKNLRTFVRDLSADNLSGPSPCASCGSLAAGLVQDAISFEQAIALLRSERGG